MTEVVQELCYSEIGTRWVSPFLPGFAQVQATTASHPDTCKSHFSRLPIWLRLLQSISHGVLEITNQLVSSLWLIPCSSFPQYLGAGPIPDLTSAVLPKHSPKLDLCCTLGSRQFELLLAPQIQLPGHDACSFYHPKHSFHVCSSGQSGGDLVGRRENPQG